MKKILRHNGLYVRLYERHLDDLMNADVLRFYPNNVVISETFLGVGLHENWDEYRSDMRQEVFNNEGDWIGEYIYSEEESTLSFSLDAKFDSFLLYQGMVMENSLILDLKSVHPNETWWDKIFRPIHKISTSNENFIFHPFKEKSPCK